MDAPCWLLRLRIKATFCVYYLFVLPVPLQIGHFPRPLTWSPSLIIPVPLHLEHLIIFIPATSI